MESTRWKGRRLARLMLESKTEQQVQNIAMYHAGRSMSKRQKLFWLHVEASVLERELGV